MLAPTIIQYVLDEVFIRGIGNGNFIPWCSSDCTRFFSGILNCLRIRVIAPIRAKSNFDLRKNLREIIKITHTFI